MSTSKFRERIRASISNEALQVALDANTERRLRGRALALESIPDWPERRRKAHDIRAEVLENLEEYVSRFIARNRENGVTVHRAQDAAEAIEIILKIAKGIQQPGKGLLVAKSKSMVSEEINLNHALEGQRIRVVETDLGEYIVQLRNEKPAHLITPAVHLRRNDVAQLFHEKLDIQTILRIFRPSPARPAKLNTGFMSPNTSPRSLGSSRRITLNFASP